MTETPWEWWAFSAIAGLTPIFAVGGVIIGSEATKEKENNSGSAPHAADFSIKIATHATDELAAMKIIESGFLVTPRPEGLSLSIDRYGWGVDGVLFVFSLECLKENYELYPYFYLFNKSALHFGDKYAIWQWTDIWTLSEILAPSPLPLSPCLKYIVTAKTEIIDLAREKGYPVRNKVEETPISIKLERLKTPLEMAILEKVPTGEFRDVVISYNKSLASTLGINFSEVKDMAKNMVLKNPEKYGIAWWEKRV